MILIPEFDTIPWKQYDTINMILVYLSKIVINITSVWFTFDQISIILVLAYSKILMKLHGAINALIIHFVAFYLPRWYRVPSVWAAVELHNFEFFVYNADSLWTFHFWHLFFLKPKTVSKAPPLHSLWALRSAMRADSMTRSSACALIALFQWSIDTLKYATTYRF